MRRPPLPFPPLPLPFPPLPPLLISPTLSSSPLPLPFAITPLRFPLEVRPLKPDTEFGEER